MALIAGAVMVAAIAILNSNAPSRSMNEPDRTPPERARNAEALADGEKKTASRKSVSDSILTDFVKSAGQVDPHEPDASRMQRKQIKMH
jgi:hypothetical protein